MAQYLWLGHQTNPTEDDDLTKWKKLLILRVPRVYFCSFVGCVGHMKNIPICSMYGILTYIWPPNFWGKCCKYSSTIQQMGSQVIQVAVHNCTYPWIRMFQSLVHCSPGPESDGLRSFFSSPRQTICRYKPTQNQGLFNFDPYKMLKILVLNTPMTRGSCTVYQCGKPLIINHTTLTQWYETMKLWWVAKINTNKQCKRKSPIFVPICHDFTVILGEIRMYQGLFLYSGYTTQMLQGSSPNFWGSWWHRVSVLAPSCWMQSSIQQRKHIKGNPNVAG